MRRLPLVLLLIQLVPNWSATAQETRQATGVKVGEVTPDSAIVWMRVTRDAERNWGGLDLSGKGGSKTVPPDVAIAELEGAAPGAPGQVRFRYSTREDLRDALSTPWASVSAVSDFAHQFRIRGLSPDTLYYYAADTAGPGGTPRHGSLRGRFRTAPHPDEARDVTFTAITCLMYCERGAPRGLRIFESMPGMNPDFTVFTGDNVYYDNEDPRATTEAVARYHWDRMYSFPEHINYLLRVPTYWQKDDHDTLSDDCWPGRSPKNMLPMTFEKGQRIFLQQVPMGENIYRRVRWGKRLELWLVEGRDFRSPNSMADGPEKTIWGARQKAWLKRTLMESDAEWKILMSPTPLVGPDRMKKSDNHSNSAFAHEGREMRVWFSQNLPDNFFVICGDRHWQYHSVDPGTGVHEFSTGAASDAHSAGTPGLNKIYHRFHRVKGGFLSVAASAGGITFRHHGEDGDAVYEYHRDPR